jgi:hypothetical protein
MGFIFSMFSRAMMSTQAKNMLQLDQMAIDLETKLGKMEDEVKGFHDKIEASMTKNKALADVILKNRSTNPRAAYSAQSSLKIGLRKEAQLHARFREATDEISRIIEAQTLVETEQMNSRTTGKCELESIIGQVGAIQSKRQKKKKTKSPAIDEKMRDQLIANKLTDSDAKNFDRDAGNLLASVNRIGEDASASDLDHDPDIEEFLSKHAGSRLSDRLNTADAAETHRVEINESTANVQVEMDVDMA